jgi:hypothetical protein
MVCLCGLRPRRPRLSPIVQSVTPSQMGQSPLSSTPILESVLTAIMPAKLSAPPGSVHGALPSVQGTNLLQRRNNNERRYLAASSIPFLGTSKHTLQKRAQGGLFLLFSITEKGLSATLREPACEEMLSQSCGMLFRSSFYGFSCRCCLLLQRELSLFTGPIQRIMLRLCVVRQTHLRKVLLLRVLPVTHWGGTLLDAKESQRQSRKGRNYVLYSSCWLEPAHQ